jgi:cis-L-3-hydroxyproline dehydratase
LHITSINAYRVLEPFTGGTYHMSKGRAAERFDSILVEMKSDTGLTGWGEMAPLGNFYSPAFSSGARAGLAELAPSLLGLDPCALSHVGRHMDTVFNGHPYIKSALDMACCDLAARAAGVPLVTLLGGGDGTPVDLYAVVTHGEADVMIERARRLVEDGYRRLQIKVGGHVRDDIERVIAVTSAVPKGTTIFCDANAGWSPFEARQFVDATRNLDYVFEQPCPSIAECLSIRRVLDKPMVLDESVTSLETLLEIHRSDAADGLTLKISRVGGVSKTRQMRDLAVDLGFLITVEDTGGAEVDTAAMAHLSLSTPKEHRLHSIAFHQWVTVKTAYNAPPVEDCKMGIPDGPGLGIEVHREALGEPFLALSK